MNDDSYYQNPHYQSRLSFFSCDAREEVDLLFLGDSLTERCDLALYYPEYIAANRGIDGDTVSGVIDRLEASLNIERVGALVLLIGINDIVDAMERYLELLCKIRERYPRTRIIALAPLPTGGIYTSMNRPALKLATQIQALAVSYNAEYLNVRSVLEDEDGELAEEYTLDGVHLSALGYERLTARIKAYLGS